MNLNPFNFQQTPQWGPAAQKHLKNIDTAHKAEVNNGKFYSTNYQGSQANGQKLVETSSHQDIKRFLKEGGSITL
ncbi:MAG: hypothetical protein KF760_30795 [Candidatus Eremiobacteraeota bacterium]|nr:hypothetical protein [Candidatus Eremiobacteraeota bacterium]MCW5871229.1 hypothetical protein [Candidatus Eremiobacteraeota bacterium]